MLGGCGETVAEKCRAFGHPVGTTEYAQCLENMTARQEEERNRALFLLGIGLMNAGQTMQQAPVYTAPQPTYLSCQSFGGIVRCHSY